MFPIDIDFSRLKEVLTYDPQAPMIFSSGIFLWLFAAFMIVYTLLQRKYTARILFVTVKPKTKKAIKEDAATASVDEEDSEPEFI